MNRIEAGKIYTATRRRQGTSSVGEWELIVTQDERGYNDVAIFVANHPTTIQEGDKFRIDQITGMSLGSRKSTDGTWHQAVSVNAVISPVETYEEFKATQDVFGGVSAQQNSFSQADVTQEMSPAYAQDCAQEMAQS